MGRRDEIGIAAAEIDHVDALRLQDARFIRYRDGRGRGHVANTCGNKITRSARSCGHGSIPFARNRCLASVSLNDAAHASMVRQSLLVYPASTDLDLAICPNRTLN